MLYNIIHRQKKCRLFTLFNTMLFSIAIKLTFVLSFHSWQKLKYDNTAMYHILGEALFYSIKIKLNPKIASEIGSSFIKNFS